MNFADFQIFREQLLRERPCVTDCAETNLCRALAHLAPPPTPAPSAKVHRCHLASEWCERFGFAPETSRRALISCGVRDSLARIFDCLAAEKAALWLPSDNYPVYGELTRAAELVPREFPTLPAPQWPSDAPVDGGEFLLVTNPLKPLGRALDAADVASLEAWLAASPQRRLMLDAVYTFGSEFDAATLRLLAGRRTILLHSLTKGWLHPRLFGIALVPPEDAGRFDEAVRAAPPAQENLARARECLGIRAETPQAVAAAMREGMTRMLAECCLAPSGLWPGCGEPGTASLRDLPRALLPSPLGAGCAGDAVGTHSVSEVASPVLADARAGSVEGRTVPAEACASYFLSVAADWRELLAERDILALPASVFGSSCDDISILSSLTFCR